MVHASSDNLYGLPVLIVDADPGKGSHTTIASALTDASAGDSIGIRPGTYTENLTIPNDIELYAIDGSDLTSNVVISGKLTFTDAITSSFSNIRFTSNGSNIIDATGTGLNQSRFQGCSFFYDTATAIICDNASASLNFQQCQFTQTENSIAMFNLTTCGTFQFIRCNITGSVTAGASTLAAGQAEFYFCKMGGQTFTTSSTGKLNFYQCNYLHDQNMTMLTTAGTGTSNVKDCVIMAGTSSAISVGSGTTVNLFGCNIESSNTNPITGAGTVVYDSVDFSGTGKIINTTTKTARSTVTGEISFDDGVNYLNNYEEGTWTPSILGSTGNPTVTYTEQLGKYTRIGNRVDVKCSVVISTISGGSGVMRISGFPFTNSDDAMDSPGIFGRTGGIDYPAGTIYLTSYSPPNTIYSQVAVNLDDGALGTVIGVANLANGDSFLHSLTYWV